MKVLITAGYDITEEKLQLLRDLGCNPVVWPSEKEPVSEDHYDTEILFSFKLFDHTDIRKFHQLKLIQLTSSGMDHVPMDWVKEKNIALCNARGIYSIPIAEWVLLKTMEIYRKSRFYEAAQREGAWKKNMEMEEIYGKTVGIIGTGSIGTETAKRLKVFGATVLGVNTSGRKAAFFDECFAIQNLSEVLERSDVLVLALPLTEETTQLMNRKMLESLKEDAVLINVSRGPVVDETGLLERLNQGCFRGVALDVFQEEPLPEDHPLWAHPKVLATPHVSFLSTSVPDRAFRLAYRNIKAFLEGKELENLQT